MFECESEGYDRERRSFLWMGVAFPRDLEVGLVETWEGMPPRIPLVRVPRLSVGPFCRAPSPGVCTGDGAWTATGLWAREDLWYPAPPRGERGS